MKKILLLSLVVSVTLSNPLLAWDASKLNEQSLDIVGLELIPCTDELLERDRNKAPGEIITHFTSDNGSFFDTSIVAEEGGRTDDISRLVCFRYGVVNNGRVAINLDYLDAYSFSVLEEYFFTNEDWTDVKHSSSRLENAVDGLPPKRMLIFNGSARTLLAEDQMVGRNCFGIRLGFVDSQEKPEDFSRFAKFYELIDEENVCFDINQHEFPGKVSNLRFNTVLGRNISLMWDALSDVESYELTYRKYDDPNSEYLTKVGITENKVQLNLDSDELYVFQLTAVKDGIPGPASAPAYYSSNLVVFEDTPVDSWYFPSLQLIQSKSIMSGYKDSNGNLTGYFGPAANLTVAEALKVVIESVDTDHIVTENTVLSDELNASWAADYFKIGAAKNLSIMKGLSLSKANKPITRGELVNMIVELKWGEPRDFMTYSLNDISNDQYANSIETAYQAGIISGYPDGTFRSNQPVNRAEVVKIAGRIL